MRPSRRQFFIFTGSTVAAAPLLVSCASSDSSDSAAGLATAEGASPSETGAHYGNLSGELLWQRYDSATPVTPSMNPETGEKVVPVPQADPATADHKAQNVPIPQEDDLMFKEDFQGLRNTFAYYVACINYARMTGDLTPALKVVHSENTVDLERLIVGSLEVPGRSPSRRNRQSITANSRGNAPLPRKTERSSIKRQT